MTYKTRKFLLASSVCVLTGGGAVLSPGLALAQNKNAPVDLQADSLSHDQGGQIVTASGDVVMKQDGRTVKADKIVYNLPEDTVIATGNVVFIDANGDKHYGNRVKFNNALKNGFVTGLQTFLTDGSRFTADKGRHVQGTRTVMDDATYTPCETCEEQPVPLWQIRAAEVEHDKETKMVSYRHARFEVKGVPVAYVPYFSHPDGSVKRKSGFLTPSAGFTSELGAFVESSYYWSIAPDKDMTAGVMVMTDAAPVGMLEWRQRWENASLIAAGSLTYSDRNDRQGGVTVEQDEEVRGHLAVDGRWDINNKWRSGVTIDYASDDQYFRQYDVGDESRDVLRNELYVERFSGRNYAAARAMAFQDLRVDESEQDQPHILPEIEASFLGEPGSVPLLGGRWSVDASLLGLVRDNDEQDMNRAHAALGWQRRFVSDYGLVSRVNANLQGTFYDVNDRTGSQTNNTVEGNSTESRAFGYINAEARYPLVRAFENAQMLVEPIASVTLSPNISVDRDIPNEDSQDVQLDALNVFEPDRFPGIDSVEDQSHATYGLRTGLYGHDGSMGALFLGQSYRFEEDNTPFEQGSGLNDQNSDVVGQVTASYKGDYTLDYRFQLNNDDLSPQRHELDASISLTDFTFSSQYLYAKELEGTEITETREQIRNAASYYVNDNWRLFGSARHDLGENPGLRTANVGVDYLGQCVSVSMIGQRNLTDDYSGDSSTEIFFRIGLKNLGEFQTSGVQLGGDEE